VGKLAYIINTNEISNRDFLVNLQNENNWEIKNGELVAVENISDELFALIESLVPTENEDQSHMQVYLHVCW